MSCKHENFMAQVNVIRLEDTGRFVAEVTVKCTDCETPFEFQGLQPGVSTSGSWCSIDGREARLAIMPTGHTPTPLQRLQGRTSLS